MHIWSDSYAVGIDEIDRQHKGFIDLVNQFPTSQKPLVASIDEILDFIGIHFDTEEQLMRQHRLVDESHMQLHRAFVARMNRYKAEPVDHATIASYMGVWITSHIKIHDKQLFSKIGQAQQK